MLAIKLSLRKDRVRRQLVSSACALALLLSLWHLQATAQSSATLTLPEFAKAGETVEVTGLFDRAPNFSGGSLQYNVLAPGGVTISSGVQISEGQRAFSIAFALPVGAKGGTWKIGPLYFYDGVNTIPLKSEEKIFTVIPRSGLVYPTGAEISLKRSQTQLLRAQGIALQSRIQNLKAELKGLPSEGAPSLLRGRLTEEAANVEETKQSFLALSAEPQKVKALVFFNDIQTSYSEALRTLPDRGAKLKRSSLIFDNPKYKASDSAPAIVQASLRALEHNELAYEIAANAESITFDLEVRSSPPGAVVSYGLRGDPTYTKASDQTNVTIKGLAYAIWVVRVEFPGQPAQEKEHNALNEGNHVVSFELEHSAAKVK